FDQWDACVAHGGCAHKPSDQGWGRGMQPVINVNWEDAQQFVQWLSQQTGKPYRLPSEAEWEYAARAGSLTAYPWGAEIKNDSKSMANCNFCGSQWDHRQTAPVGSFPTNKFGLHDMNGNVWELVEDCYHDNYRGAPGNGEAWSKSCNRTARVSRGGNW